VQHLAERYLLGPEVVFQGLEVLNQR